MQPNHVVAALASVLVMSSVAFAQDPKTAKPAGDPKAAKPAAAAAQDAKAAMPVPTPAPETKKLAFMVGTFTSDEHFYANPMMPETRSKGTIEGKFVLGDFFLATEVKSEAMGGFKGHSYTKYDAEKKQYTMHWFDSMGTAQEYTNGQWKDDKTLVFECDSHCMGMPARLRSAYIITGAGTWTIKEEADLKDGKGFVPVMEIQFKKTSN